MQNLCDVCRYGFHFILSHLTSGICGLDLHNFFNIIVFLKYYLAFFLFFFFSGILTRLYARPFLSVFHAS